QAAELAVIAGSDMDMESYHYVKYLEGLVDSGAVDEALVNDAVKRILRVKFELGLFDDPFKYCDREREKQLIGSKKNMDAVLDMAKKSIVLLKNEGGLLPLQKSGLKIGLIGPLADDKDSPLGSWRLAADDNSAVSVLEGLKGYPGNALTHKQGVALTLEKPAFVLETKINTTDRSGFEEAVQAARNQDVVIMVLGEHGFQTGEGRSRVSLDLPGLQQELLEAVYKVNKNIVLVLMNGRPLAINWADTNVPAIVEAWHLGTQSGHAIAQVLYGDYNPSGKLPMTFPKNVGQVPIYYNYKNTGRPTIPAPDLVFWSHYTDMDNDPLYPFGHGLSYSKFRYGDLKLSEKRLIGEGKMEVSFTLTNMGKYEGKEVVQCYLRDLVASVTRPVKELKDFKMVSLKPGESREVIFTLDKSSLAFYSANNKWETEPGDFKVFVGGSSKTVLEGDFSYER
ncbi:MAG: glycosyl hydrolase, partial [Flavobacteriales bacterium]